MKDKISLEELDQIIKSSINNDTIDPELSSHQPNQDSEPTPASITPSNEPEHDNEPVGTIPDKQSDGVNKRMHEDDQQGSNKRSDIQSQELTTTETPPSIDKPSRKMVIHDGMEIPADSELLNANNAFNSYTEVSNLTNIPLMKNSHLSALPLPIIAPDYVSPRTQLLIQTLPTLDNLSTQLLRIFTIGPYHEVIELASNLENIKGATFRDLTSIFEFTKKLYSDDPFLTVNHIMNLSDIKLVNFFKNYQQSIDSTLRKVNLSTFLLATLGIIEVGFYYLNESFLNIFCPLESIDPETTICAMNNKIIQGNGISINNINNSYGNDLKVGKLLKHQAILYLELKTQAYISAIEAGDKSREEILDDILPINLQDLLIDKRGTKLLNQSELEFIEKCKTRRISLLNHQDDSTLSQEYEWFQFLKNLFDFISKNMAFLIWGNKKVSNDLKFFTNLPQSSSANPSMISSPSPSTNAGDITASSHTTTTNNLHNNPHPASSAGNSMIYDPNEDLLPSEIQQRQLQLATGPGPKSRISSRRPWTREEEKALRQALELEGPHWSNILELFGPGGQINESLKNRNQTQLKDKARNWKMFFLKSGLPVPQYLSKVTGDLERDDRNRRKKLAQKKDQQNQVISS